MKYTIDDIPYLVGLHFILKDDFGKGKTYLIDSFNRYGLIVNIDWPNRPMDKNMAEYLYIDFLRNLNNGNWIITDLPSIDVTDRLYESEDYHKPKLSLSFNPPITTETEYTNLIDLLNVVYPGLKWYSGKNVTEANMFKLRGCSFYNFNIGYFPEEPNRLTYTSDDFDEGIPHQDGRQWVKDHTVDVEDIFNKLHESKSAENPTKGYRPKLLLSFDPPIETTESLNKVLDILDGVYPGLTWVNHKSVLTYNTFEQEIDRDSFIGTLTIGFWEEQPDELSWGGSREGDETYDYELYEDGWRWVQKYTPNVDDAFSKLYESEDDFEWAKQLVNVPITLGYLWEIDALSKGDEIALYGEVRDSEKLLFNLTGQGFKVYQIIYKRDHHSGNATGEIDSIKLEWLTSLSDRPVNWRVASTGNYFETDPSTMITDGMLRVEYITPPQEKINESEDDFEWVNDITPPSNVDQNLWVVTNRDHYYPQNGPLWGYFNIPGVDKCFSGDIDRHGDNIYDEDCLENLYTNGTLIIPERGDECYSDIKVWEKDTYFSKHSVLPIRHMIRVKDGGHFVITNKGVKPIE